MNKIINFLTYAMYALCWLLAGADVKIIKLEPGQTYTFQYEIEEENKSSNPIKVKE